MEFLDLQVPFPPEGRLERLKGLSAIAPDMSDSGGQPATKAAKQIVCSDSAERCIHPDVSLVQWNPLRSIKSGVRLFPTCPRHDSSPADRNDVVGPRPGKIEQRLPRQRVGMRGDES
jgi:hypothetical protein